MKTTKTKSIFAIRQIQVRCNWVAAMLCLTALLALPDALCAGNLYVPNYSFESPDIGTNSPYAAPILDSWEESAQPDGYNPADFDGSPWSYLVGTFYNLPNFTNSMATNSSYIDNNDGAQAAFIFAVPEVAIFQDYNSIGGTETNADHAFNAIFNVGKTYTLTVGLVGGGGDMAEGSTLQLSLYYRDASNNMVTVATTTVTNALATFPTTTHLVDFQVQVPGVQATDPWAGQNIGIQLLATPDFNDPAHWGGYWDVDNIRLAEGIYVPNYSFESPDIGTNSPYAAPILDAWEESAQPDGYNPADFDGSPWSYLVGTFYNLPNFTNATATNSSYIDNNDGVQAAFIFAVPDVAIFQDYNSIGGTEANSDHAFNAIFNVGKAYTLTAGLIGGGGGMADGSTFQLSLYYRDASSNMVPVAVTTVTNTLANFPTTTHFVDFQVQVSDVKASDPWAGRNIGIQLIATPDFNDPEHWGGYWDVDNVRLVETTALNLDNPAMINGQFQFTAQSEPGAVFQILATTNLSLPATNWTSLATITNATGSVFYMDQTGGPAQRYYTAQQLR